MSPGIELGTSRIEGRALTKCATLVGSTLLSESCNRLKRSSSTLGHSEGKTKNVKNKITIAPGIVASSLSSLNCLNLLRLVKLITIVMVLQHYSPFHTGRLSLFYLSFSVLQLK